MSSVARALSTETGGVAEPQAWCVDLWSPLPARVGSKLACEQRTVLFPSTEGVLPEASEARKQQFLTPGPLVGLGRVDGTLARAQGTVNAPSIGDAAGTSEQRPGLSFLAASTPQPLVGLVRAGGTLALGTSRAPSTGDDGGAFQKRPGPCFLIASTPHRVGLARASGTLSLVRDTVRAPSIRVADDVSGAHVWCPGPWFLTALTPQPLVGLAREQSGTLLLAPDTVRAPSIWWDSQGAGGDSRAPEWRPGPLGSSLAALILQLPAGGTPARALSTATSSPRRPVSPIEMKDRVIIMQLCNLFTSNH